MPLKLCCGCRHAANSRGRRNPKPRPGRRENPAGGGKGCGDSAKRHRAVWSPNADPGLETRPGSSGQAGKTPQGDLQTRNLQPLEGSLRPGVRCSLVLREARSSLGGLCAGRSAAKNQARFHLDERRGGARSEQLRGLFKPLTGSTVGNQNLRGHALFPQKRGRV